MKYFLCLFSTIICSAFLLSLTAYATSSDALFAYGEKDGVFIINASDALLNTEYASYSNRTSKETGINSVSFSWEITKSYDSSHKEVSLTPIRHSPDYDKSISEKWMWSSKSDTNDAPYLSYKVLAKESGDYYFSYFSNNPNNGADSFHVSVNGKYQFTTMNAMTGGSDTNHAAVGSAWFHCDKTPLRLTKGINTITIYARESGIALNQLMLSSEKPMSARYIYFESQRDSTWHEPSDIVAGYTTLNDFDDLVMDLNESASVNFTTDADNVSAISSTDNVTVTKNGNTLSITSHKSGYSSITVTAEKSGCSPVTKQFIVNVNYQTEGSETKLSPQNISVAPGSETSNSIAFIWDPPADTSFISGYNAYLDGSIVSSRSIDQTHFTATNLSPDTEYAFCAEAVYSDGTTAMGKIIHARTATQGTIIDVTASPYFAKGDGTSLNTAKIQSAINDCPKGGTVLIPEGVFISGALDLKSHITLQVEGTLQGSSDPLDYLYPDVKWDNDTIGQRILTRYEGWELLCHRSLINIGHINIYNRKEITCENVKITGKGKIIGGGSALRNNSINLAKEKGWAVGTTNVYERTRGRLISIVQSYGVYLHGIEMSEAPCWTIHMIYSDTVTTHGINIYSRVINGDGWDPDSSRNCLLFDSTIETGDDCVAIKSGKNPEGDIVSIPTENIKIFDIRCGGGGHGLAMGSEISGGINNIEIRNCKVLNTLYGLQLKGTPERGGYITNLHVKDCTLNMLLMKSNVNYNGDGASASDKPYFNNLTFENIHITGTDVNSNKLSGERGAIEISGFDTFCNHHNHLVNNVNFNNITLGSDSNHHVNIWLENCENIIFTNAKQLNGKTPSFALTGKTNSIFYNGNNILNASIYDSNLYLSDASFYTRSFPPQTDTASFSYIVKAYEKSDGIMCLGSSFLTPSAWNAFPVMVRIRPDGLFDVRNGSEFSYTNAVSYDVNTEYFVRIEADIKNKTYSVFITNPKGETITLAKDFLFRSDAPFDKDLGKVCMRGGSGVSSGLFEVKNFSVQNKTKLEITNISQGDSLLKFRVISYDNAKCNICCAFYSEDGALLRVNTSPLNLKQFEVKDFALNQTFAYDSFKIFIWNKDSLHPMSLSKTEKDWL